MTTLSPTPRSPSEDTTDEATDKPPATDGITADMYASMIANLKKDKHPRFNVRLAGLVPSGYLKESKYGTYVFGGER